MFFFRKTFYLFNHIVRYLKYFFKSRHWKGHGIHSPFVFDLYNSVIDAGISTEDMRFFKEVRADCRKDNTPILCPELGAGSKTGKNSEIRIKDFLRNSSINNRYGKILYNLSAVFQPGIILELGTGIGISTLYLKKGNPESELYTIEGCEDKANYAKNMLKKYGFPKIHVKTGLFESHIKKMNELFSGIDLIYIDGDHSYEKTINNFNLLKDFCHNNSVIILDDIHWSCEMEKAWKSIQQKKEVTLTIDLFQLGLVFFKKELTKQNFIIKY